MRRLVCFLSIIFIAAAINTAKSQSSVFTPDEKIPASPIAASFSKYGGFSDDLYTGNVSISIPIYTITDNDVSLPVSLNTRTGSIKVAEIPGWVGSGWNLSTGGVITRSTNHLPDDLYINDISLAVGYFYNSSLNQEIDSLISRQIPLSTGLADQLTNGSLDMTPDEFSFNIPGYSGSFSYVLDELVIYPKMNIKIERLDNISEHYVEGWEITTPEGLKYTFISSERSEKEFKVGPNTYESRVATTWHLEKIESLKLGGGEINIHYRPGYGERAIKCVKDIWDTWYCDYFGSEDPSSYVDSEDQINIIPIHYVDSIVTLNSCLSFSVSQIENFQNEEYKNDQSDWKLDTIKLFDRNRDLIRMWILDYESSVEDDRIQLFQLIEKSPDNSLEKKHSFDYYGTLGNTSFSSRNIDHWGYYNFSGTNNQSLIPGPLYTGGSQTTRDGFFYASILGALRRIQYPTGGFTEFVYEPHDYSFLGNDTLSHINTTITYELDTVFTFSQSYFTSYDYPANYSIIEPSRVDISMRCTSEVTNTWSPSWIPCGCGDKYSPFEEAPLGEATPFLVNSGFLNFTSSFFSNYFPVYDAWGHTFDSVVFEVKIYKQIITSGYNKINLGGGIRLQEIVNYDGKRYETKSFDYRLPDETDRSSGAIGNVPIYIFNACGWIDGCCPVYLRNGAGLTEISCTQGSYIGYSVVTELINDSIRTDHYYTSFREFQDLAVNDAWFGYPLPDAFHKKLSRDYLRGKPTRKVSFVGERKLRQSEYEYTVNVSDTISKWSFIFKSVPETEQANCLWYKEGIISENITLNRLLETDYDLNAVDESPLIQDTTSYSYSSYFDIRSKARKRSDGIVESIEYTYPYDYENDALFQDWIEYSHIYNTIISESKSLDSNLIEEIINTYDSHNPSATIRRSYFGGSLLVDTLMYFELWAGVDQLEQFQKRGTYFSYIWDEIDDNIIAQFENAKRDQVYYEDFEQSSAGNVVKNGENARSGDYYLSSGSFTIPSALFTPEYGVEYQMSYWYYKAGLGWRWIVTSFNNSITTDGSRIDDIVICPINTLFTTYTYKPLIGMTSKTDSNGFSIYYEYDSLGRLMFIRDHNNNILKYFNYNYKN